MLYPERGASVSFNTVTNIAVSSTRLAVSGPAEIIYEEMVEEQEDESDEMTEDDSCDTRC